MQDNITQCKRVSVGPATCWGGGLYAVAQSSMLPYTSRPVIALYPKPQALHQTARSRWMFQAFVFFYSSLFWYYFFEHPKHKAQCSEYSTIAIMGACKALTCRAAQHIVSAQGWWPTQGGLQRVCRSGLELPSEGAEGLWLWD